MRITAPTVELAASVTAVVASSAFLATGFRYRRDPAARPLVAVAAALFAGSVAHLGLVDLELGRVLLDGPADPGPFWQLVAFDLTALVGVSWFLFALQYTGRDDSIASVARVAVAGVLVLLVGPHFDLTVSGPIVGFSTRVSNVVLGLAVVLAVALALIGLFLVLDATLKHKAYPASQTAVHVAALGSVLLAPFVATTVREPLVTPLSVAASSLLFSGLIVRYRVFETLPVVSLVGRDRVIEEMSDGVVIVGADRRVRDLNPAAEALFGVDRSIALGEPLPVVIPDAPDLSTATGSGETDVILDSGRIVSVSVEATTDSRERSLGWLLVCRDITEKRQQARRLRVLTRVVAGAATEQMRSVTDVTAAIDAGECEPTRGGDRIRETTTTVAALVDDVRDIERRLSAGVQSPPPSADLRDVLGSLSVPDDATLTVDSAAERRHVAADPELIAATLEVLLVAAGSATLRIDADESIAASIAPFDASDPDSIEALSLRVVRVAAESASWELRTVPDVAPPAVRIVIPGETGSGGELA
ncbi:histidine kinase N-terminal 7TM domain-containing protein [Halapricum desulfuricans]|uniref:Signal transduction histidine kinase, contains PAS domain n=1 Tax=Halapricum desulfuricans TaxID=2841257 RepID=A0A897MWM3_9EURY|nr:histidine kinase N-terminal 7TM domain-containing protein [Halapricum desulfuricans]QSG04992.1 Signal transduction histidine kinase, contains PAS domain [Halapricum desulfuricans]